VCLPFSASTHDTKYAAAAVLYMIADTTTHSMVIIPKCMEGRLKTWLEDMSKVASYALEEFQPNSIHHFPNSDMRFDACIRQSVFFGDFSPELKDLLTTSRSKDILGVFRPDVVNLVQALLGETL